MKKALKIFNWIFSIFCMLCLLAYGFNSGTILMFLLGIASLPVKSIREMWEKLPKHKVLRPVIIGFLFFMFMGMMPTTENGNTEQIAEIETETVTETKTEAATEIATEAVTETATETEQIEAESETETEVQPEVVETESTESTQAVEAAMVQTQASTEENLYVSDIPANSVDAAEESNSTVEEAVADSELETSNEKSDVSDEKSDTSNEIVTSESSVISDSTSVNTSSDETNSESIQNQASTTDLDSGNAVSSGDVSADAGSGSLMVWKTATGSKYHSTNHCGRTNPANATQITEEEAIRQGLGKCSKCW